MLIQYATTSGFPKEFTGPNIISNFRGISKAGFSKVVRGFLSYGGDTNKKKGTIKVIRYSHVSAEKSRN